MTIWDPSSSRRRSFAGRSSVAHHPHRLAEGPAVPVVLVDRQAARLRDGRERVADRVRRARRLRHRHARVEPPRDTRRACNRDDRQQRPPAPEGLLEGNGRAADSQPNDAPAAVINVPLRMTCEEAKAASGRPARQRRIGMPAAADRAPLVVGDDAWPPMITTQYWTMCGSPKLTLQRVTRSDRYVFASR